MRARDPHGAASVEHVGLVLLIALLVIGAIAALAAAPPTDEARRLGSSLDRKIRCPARLPDPCWQDPLTEAYRRPLAGLVRALAPTPRPVAGPSGLPLVPVDFRYCRTESCAVPGDRAGLTRSNRRVTAFTSVLDHRRSGGGVEITYWLYRPGIGWDEAGRHASAGRRAVRGHTPPRQREPGARAAGDALRAGPLRLLARGGAAVAVEGGERLSGVGAALTSGRRGAPSRRGRSRA